MSSFGGSFPQRGKEAVSLSLPTQHTTMTDLPPSTTASGVPDPLMNAASNNAALNLVDSYDEALAATAVGVDASAAFVNTASCAQAEHTSRPKKKRAPVKKVQVNHTYHDYSQFTLPTGITPKKHFPAKLHDMLADPSNHHAITWMPHGRSLKVINRELLAKEVLPRYSSSSKYESFTRNLNNWGFKRMYQEGADRGCYYHENFLRGMPHLTASMACVASLKKGTVSAANVGEEPNFYEMAKQFPLPPLVEVAREEAPFADPVPAATANNLAPMTFGMPLQHQPVTFGYHHPMMFHNYPLQSFYLPEVSFGYKVNHGVQNYAFPPLQPQVAIHIWGLASMLAEEVQETSGDLFVEDICANDEAEAVLGAIGIEKTDERNE